MSNALAVATVTEALRQFISRELPPEIQFGAEVRAQKPPTEAFTTPTITIFCYLVTPNAALRNRDAPTRASDGTPVTRSQAVLDLNYLISFYGDETRLEPQQLLGSVVRSLHEWPVLSRADIETAIAQQPALAGSDLLAAVDRVRFTPTHLDIDDLYKLWTMMSGTPFALSVSYLASVVAIDGRTAGSAGRPVLTRTVRAVAGGPPAINQVLAQAPGGQPVEGPVPRGASLVVVGERLASTSVWARVGETDVPVPADGIASGRLVVPLPDTLSAGVYPLRILQGIPNADPGAPAKALESNEATVVRQTRVTSVDAAAVPGGPPVLSVEVDLPIGDLQRVAVLLDERNPPADRPARTYRVDAPYPLSGRTDPGSLRVPLPGVVPGGYLVRVEVDGAPSALSLAGGVFAAPVVEVPGP